MEKGPLPPPALEVKERDKDPADLDRRRQLGSQWISHNLQGVCGLGPPGLVRLLPRGVLVKNCVSSPRFRPQGTGLSTDGQLLQITTPLFSFPPGIPPTEGSWMTTTTGPGETTTILCTTTPNKGRWPEMRSNCRYLSVLIQ